MTGPELIQEYARYQARSDNALDALLTSVRAYAMSVTADEDLSQEVVTLCWRFLHQYKPEKGTFASWTRTIIDNARKMRYRRGGNMVPVTDDFLTDLDHQAVEHQRPTPELLRELLLHGPEQTRELVSIALSTGDLYSAGKLLGLTPNQVLHKRRLMQKFVREISAA
ncbi:MAG: sigma factor [Acidobacteriota bacterium]